MRLHLTVLFACVFVVMLGLGITMPVLPFYVERLAVKAGTSQQSIVMHVTLLTAVYAFMQLLFAPLWGRWSDRIGRRPLLLAGIGGYVVAQLLFGLATSLWLLYVARVIGGILSSATLPMAAAYVADVTDEKWRDRGMAWLGTSVSLGFVVGPALGGPLSRAPLHIRARFGHLLVDGFSIPFFIAAALGMLTLIAAVRWLPESMKAPALKMSPTAVSVGGRPFPRGLGGLLTLAVLAPLGLALFEATFALYAQQTLKYGAAAVGAVFVVCGLVMTVFQVGALTLLAGRISDMAQISIGFALMGFSLAFLVLARSSVSVQAVVGVLALGSAMIGPTLAAAISRRSGTDRVGAALGIQTAASSLGQASGPVIGGALFVWNTQAPYLITGALLVVVAAMVAWRSRRGADPVGASGHHVVQPLQRNIS